MMQGRDRLTAQDVIVTLDLSAHQEGGYFRETYRSDSTVATANGERSASTSILYLLTQAEPSRFHRLRADEIWFYHSGALAELVMLPPLNGGGRTKTASREQLPEHRVIGPGSPYTLVPAGWWIGVRSVVGDRTDWGMGRAPERRWTADRRSGHEFDWTLVSCVVTPGFEYSDLEMADRDTLLRDYPLAKEVITALT